MTSRLVLAAVAVVVWVAPLAARAPIEELPCDETEFADVTAIDCDFVEAFLDADFGEIAGCELDRLRVSPRRDGFVLRARWRRCDDSTLVLPDGQPVPARLRLRLEADSACELLSGTLRGRGLRQPLALMSMLAVEDRCEALLDEDDGFDEDDEEDEDDFEGEAATASTGAASGRRLRE